jgi:hypothetical protein
MYARRPQLFLALLILPASLLLLTGCGGATSSAITKARLERSLPQSFANRYVQQARLIGNHAVTVQSLRARADCDKGGPKVPDHGPGADWICYMYFNDPATPLPDGVDKFDLNVHSNGCYTAAGQTKFTGVLMITDTKGHDVLNPAFEWDACFDPRGDNRPTGVVLLPPSILVLPIETVKPDANGTITTELSCALGTGRCTGSVSATFGTRSVGTATYDLKPGEKQSVQFKLIPTEVQHGGRLFLTAKGILGAPPRSGSSLTVKPI